MVRFLIALLLGSLFLSQAWADVVNGSGAKAE